MSINTVQGPLIRPSVNNDNNTTRTMRVNSLNSNIISDGIASISNGYISNLINPTTGNQIATKYYVDNTTATGVPGGPVDAIQYNNGTTFAGSANLTLSNPTLSTATLNINGTLTNGTMSLSGSQISGLINPTSSQQAATKNYVDGTVNKLGVISINLQQNVVTTYTPVQIYNNIINIDFSPDNILGSCNTNMFPTAANMKIFLGPEFTVGKSWTTIFVGPSSADNDAFVSFQSGTVANGVIFSPVNYDLCAAALPATAVLNYASVSVLSIVTNSTTGSEQYYSYVSDVFSNVTTNAQITDQGILTPSFGNGKFITESAIIYPIPNNPVMSSNGITYTYANLQQFLIVRTGTAPMSDTFVPASTLVTANDFIMGGGTFRFFIQNSSPYDLFISPSAGWTFKTPNAGSGDAILPGYCVAYWVTVTISPPACLVYMLGNNPITG